MTLPRTGSTTVEQGLGTAKTLHVLARTLVVLGLLAMVLIVPAAVHSAPGTSDEVHYTFTGPTSVSFNWRGTGTDIRYGPTTSYGATVVSHAPSPLPFSSAGPWQEADLTGLTPGATYHYSIGNGPDHTFRTAPTGSFRFDMVADIGSSLATTKVTTVQGLIAADNPAFVLMAGDLTYGEHEGQTSVDRHFNDVMAWSQQAAYMPAWGNHEYENPAGDDLRNYKGRFNLPNAHASPGAPAPGCCGEDWGWFDAGGVRFISYPEPYSSSSWTDWQTQVGPIMAAAQADPSITFIVTFGHRPAYSTGYHSGELTLAGILNTLGDTYSKYVLNLNGHSHDYERFEPIHGVTHITAGGGGYTLEVPWSGTDSRTAFRAMHLAHLRVDVSSTGLLIEAICGPPSSLDEVTCVQGSVIDSTTIGPNPPPPTPPTQVLYVGKNNPNCSNGGSGTETQPFCSIGTAATRVVAGQTVLVDSGSYNETVTVSSSGTAIAPIVFAAKPGATVTVTGSGSASSNGFYMSGRSYITVQGFNVTQTGGDGIVVKNSSFVTLAGNHVSYVGLPQSGKTAKGIRLEGATDSSVTNNTVDHATSYGIYLLSGATRNLVQGNVSFSNAFGYQRAASGIRVYSSSGNTISSNVCYANEDSGLDFDKGNNNLVVNNVTYDNGDHGIDNLTSTGQRIIGNTVYDNVTAGINVEGNSTGATVANNIAVDNGIASPRTRGNIRVESGSTSGTTMNHDLVYLTTPDVMLIWNSVNYSSLAAFRSATGQETNGTQASPRFQNAAAGNFHLTTGSPAIDSANSGANGQEGVDVEGTGRIDDPATPNTGTGPRTYDDRGAYEFPAPPIDHIVISPATASIVAGGTRAYTAQAFDAGNNLLGDVTASTTFTIAPNGSCTGNVCTATTAGAHTVTGNNGGQTSTATLTVTAGPLDHLVLAPTPATTVAGTTQAYTAEGFDAWNNTLGDRTATTTFTIAPNGSCTGATCTATLAGAHTVSGTSGGKTGTASLTVTGGSLHHIVVSPASASIAPGGTQSYTAEGRDQYDNSLGDVTSSTTFTIAPSGSCTGNVCTATAAGAHTVTGNNGGKTSTATLTVTAGALDHIAINPASASITAGGSQTFTAQGFDAGDNPLGDVTAGTTLTIAPNGSCSGNVCTATTAGAHTVTGTNGGKTSTATLTVTAGPLDHLVLSPASATIDVGGSQPYIAQGRDQYDNSLGDVTAGTIFTIAPDGSCTGATCTASVAGAHTVTGTNSGKTGTASLQVNAAVVDHIVLSPASASITAAGSQAYTAEGFNAQNNSLGDVTSSTTFTIAPNGSCTGNVCTATTAGAHTVTGNNGGKTDSATLTVTAGPLDHLALSPASATIAPGGSQSYTAEGRDQYDNPLGDVTATTTFTIAPNGSCTGVACTATASGAHTVTGTSAGKTGMATLTVAAGSLDHITISPASATIGPGGSQAYTAEAFDAQNNSLGDVTATTTFTIAPNGSCTGATCTASAAGAHTVTGTHSGKSATATLQVSAPVLDHIVISPPSASITAAGSQAYTAQGFDAQNNSLGDVTSSTTFTIAPNGSCTGNVCTATTAGAHTVTGNNGGKTSTATLTVTAGPLDHLALSPASATIAPGGSQSYTAEGRDQYDNPLGDRTASTTFTIAPNGSCTGTTCTATLAGAHTVTGTSGGKTGTATLTVGAGALDRITISPANATIARGDSQQYTAEGFDAQNNSLGDVTSSTTFTIAPNGSCTGNACTATVGGPHTVTGTNSGKTSTASLSVSFVTNPGFETNTTGWNTSGSSSGVTLTRVAGGHSGGWAAQISNTGTTAASYAVLQDSPNFVATTSAGTYTGKLWVRADAAGGAFKLKFQEYTGSTLVGSVTAQVTLTTSWQQVTVTYTVTSPGSTLDFQSYTSNAQPGVVFYADDASIELG